MDSFNQKTFVVKTGIFFDSSGSMQVDLDNPSTIFGEFESESNAKAVAEMLRHEFSEHTEDSRADDGGLTMAQFDQLPVVQEVDHSYV